MVVRGGSSQAKFILTDFIHWIDVYMSRSPKDKPAEEVYVPTTVTSRRPGRTKLRPVDHPRYIMPLSEASNPYKGQSGNGVVGRLGRTIVGRKKGLLSFLLRTANTNRIKKLTFRINIDIRIYLSRGISICDMAWHIFHVRRATGIINIDILLRVAGYKEIMQCNTHMID